VSGWDRSSQEQYFGSASALFNIHRNVADRNAFQKVDRFSAFLIHDISVSPSEK
jgi:hypothetical protein